MHQALTAQRRQMKAVETASADANSVVVEGLSYSVTRLTSKKDYCHWCYVRRRLLVYSGLDKPMILLTMMSNE
jgi:hypothetical protein